MANWDDDGDEMPAWRIRELENQRWSERLGGGNGRVLSPAEVAAKRQLEKEQQAAEERQRQQKRAAAERRRAEQEQVLRRQIVLRRRVLIACGLWILTSFGAFVYGFAAYDTNTAENPWLLAYAGIGGILSPTVTIAIAALWQPKKP